MNKFLAILSVAVLAATGAQAVTVNLYGSDGGDATVTGDTATFNKEGVSGTITAHSTYATSGYPIITTNTYGLGVQNGPNDVAYVPGSGDDPIRGGEIDGRYYSDWLTFTFNSAVKLISVGLANFNAGSDPSTWNDHAYIEVDGSPVEASYSGNWTYFFGDVIATSFSIRAMEMDDEFLAYNFTVAPIPLPASSLLLLGGLAGFGLMRRRKRSS